MAVRMGRVPVFEHPPDVAVLMDGFPILIELAAFKGHRPAADRTTWWLQTRHIGLQCRRVAQETDAQKKHAE